VSSCEHGNEHYTLKVQRKMTDIKMLMNLWFHEIWEILLA